MCQDIQLVRKFIHIHAAHISIIRAGFKTVTLCHIQSRIQTLCGTRAKRHVHIFFLRHLFTVDAAEFTDILDHLIFVSVHPGADFLFVHKINPQSLLFLSFYSISLLFTQMRPEMIYFIMPARVWFTSLPSALPFTFGIRTFMILPLSAPVGCSIPSSARTPLITSVICSTFISSGANSL